MCCANKLLSHPTGCLSLRTPVLCLQYAGNVLVYGAMSPCDGDWFGGVNSRNAAEFLNGVINAEVSTKETCRHLQDLDQAVHCILR